MGALKRLIKRLVPERLHPSHYIRVLVFERTANCVVAGPFSGLRYVWKSRGSELTPKLLGSYEHYLQPIIREIITGGYDRIVDVGAGEGYYAVGLAMRCPQARVIVFDSDEEARRLLAEMARLNDAEGSVEIHGTCDPVELAEALRGGIRRVLICDCEGYEEILLDPVAVGELRESSILVEMHEFRSRGITERVRRRMELTHDIQEIWEAKYEKEFPYHTLATRLVPVRHLRRVAFSEERPERMNWLWMKPKSQGEN